MDFLDFVRKVAEERKARGLVIKGGKGSGWFAPPKGTHTAGARAKGAAAMPTKRDMQRAANVATIADHSPSRLKRVATTSLLAARGVTEDVRTQYKGEKGTGAQRATLDNRLKTLDAELKRRGIDNPANAVKKQWPEWKRMGKTILTTGKGTKGKSGKGKREGSLIDLGVHITQLRNQKYKLELDLLRTKYKPKYRRQRQAKVDELQSQIDDLMERKRELRRRKGYKYS